VRADQRALYERERVPASNHAFHASPAIEARPRPAGDGFDVARVWGGYDDWEPVTAADPSTHDVYQMTTRLGGPKACPTCAANSIVFRRSRDGGETWGPDQFVIASAIDQYDPQIRVARGGAVYIAFLQDFVPGVTFRRSIDHGKTWSAPAVFTLPVTPLSWNDRPALVISPSGRDVYLAFNHSDSWIVASHDYGRTFGVPVKTNDDHRYYFHSAGTVAPNGAVYVTAQDYSQTYIGATHVDVIRSNDGGRTWRTVRVDTSLASPRCVHVPGCYYGFLGPVAGLASDAAGTLLLAYNVNDVPYGPQQVFARTSRDGATWSARVQISDPDPSVNNGFPAIASGAGAGDFRVAFMGTRAALWDTWYRRFDGRRWSLPVRLSNRKGGTPYEHPGGFDFPYGDYLGISVDGGGALHAIWGAGPNYNGPGGTWYTRGE
jgi:hypothetical protein